MRTRSSIVSRRKSHFPHRLSSKQQGNLSWSSIDILQNYQKIQTSKHPSVLVRYKGSKRLCIRRDISDDLEANSSDSDNESVAHISESTCINHSQYLHNAAEHSWTRAIDSDSDEDIHSRKRLRDVSQSLRFPSVDARLSRTHITTDANLQEQLALCSLCLPLIISSSVSPIGSQLPSPNISLGGITFSTTIPECITGLQMAHLKQVLLFVSQPPSGTSLSVDACSPTGFVFVEFLVDATNTSVALLRLLSSSLNSSLLAALCVGQFSCTLDGFEHIGAQFLFEISVSLWRSHVFSVDALALNAEKRLSLTLPLEQRSARRLVLEYFGALAPVQQSPDADADADADPTDDSDEQVIHGAELERFYALFKQHRETTSTSSSPSTLVTAQPRGLLCALRAYQRDAIAWMLGREQKQIANKSTSLDAHTIHALRLCPLQRSRSISVESKESELCGPSMAVYFHAASGRFFTDVSLVRPTGGILADEMGLGKTVELLALLLLHPRPPALLAEPDAYCATSYVSPEVEHSSSNSVAQLSFSSVKLDSPESLCAPSIQDAGDSIAASFTLSTSSTHWQSPQPSASGAKTPKSMSESRYWRAKDWSQVPRLVCLCGTEDSETPYARSSRAVRSKQEAIAIQHLELEIKRQKAGKIGLKILLS